MKIVVKIGTNLLTQSNGSVNKKLISAIARDIVSIIKKGHSVIIVTSGAIGAGMGRVGIAKRPSVLKEKQALAAIGQPILMSIYEKVFSKYKIPVAQVLVTRRDFDERHTLANARNTLLELMVMKTVAIINENDTVAVEEINFGDNDTLAAHVGVCVGASLLVLLTDVEGLYKGIPGKSELICSINKITREHEGYASAKSSSGKGIGGMSTKISAAKIATASGIKTVIANGRVKDIISKIALGEKIGTHFECNLTKN